MTPIDKNDPELAILGKIHDASLQAYRLTQRELALAARLSLGMTNALLKRLVEKGLVRLTHHSAKAVHYALTSEGVAELSRRVAGNLAEASRSADANRERIESFVGKAAAQGAVTLVLSGASEIDFILEKACERHGIAFVKSADRDRAEALGRRTGVVCVTAEEIRAEDTVGLMSIIMGRTSA